MNDAGCRRAFIAALYEYRSINRAIKATGLEKKRLYEAKYWYPCFGSHWDAIIGVTAAWRKLPRASPKQGWEGRVINAVAVTGNLTRAAALAGISLRAVNRRRSTDREFAYMVYLAKQEGIDSTLFERAGSDPGAAVRLLGILEHGARRPRFTGYWKNGAPAPPKRTPKPRVSGSPPRAAGPTGPG